MQIHGLHQSQATQSIHAAQNSRPASKAIGADAPQPAQADQLDLSPEALAISRSEAASTSEIRMEKVAAIRQAIADGVYETPEKLSLALDKMLDTFV
ncbi:MAG: flagellar biosynthesis anti-sigma factor FlgM [bacterium]|nr:flagellar biosynthesis anti-sigma factor FlgM [bacterium]